MKEYERIQKKVQECKSAMEVAGFLDGVKVAATVYCKKNYPEEIIEEEEYTEISIYGMNYYLDSDIS